MVVLRVIHPTDPCGEPCRCFRQMMDQQNVPRCHASKANCEIDCGVLLVVVEKSVPLVALVKAVLVAQRHNRSKVPLFDLVIDVFYFCLAEMLWQW